MDLTLDHLACRRAGRLVFEDVSFRMKSGSAAALRGPNGAGKSTLLRQLAGFLPVVSGDAVLGGFSLKSDRTGFQEQIAYAGHLDAVKPALTVLENLAIWAQLSGTVAERVDDALAQFGLDHISERPAAQCSAGQKRRLGLARLLIAKRPLWLLDEPTVSLDSEATSTIARLVREHTERGGLALIATHTDLGLGAIPELILSATLPETNSNSDPFLAGNW